MKVSDDARATIAALFRTWGMKPERSWEEVDRLIAAAPAPVCEHDWTPLRYGERPRCRKCDTARPLPDSGFIELTAPVGVTLSPSEPTEEVRPVASQRPCPTDLEWSMGVGNTKWHDTFDSVGFYCRAVSAEAHRLAARRAKGER